MAAMLLVATLLGYAITLNRAFNRPTELFLLPSASAIILILYVSGLAGLLRPMAIALLTFGVLLFILSVFLLYKAGDVKNQFTPGLSVFLLLAIIFYLLTCSEYYHGFVFWDDFSHWARVSKVISFNHRLVEIDDPVWFKDYPPGSALFHYLSYQVSGYSDQITFYAQIVLMLAGMAGITGAIDRRKAYIIAPALFFFYMLMHTFHAGLHTMSVDLLTGLLFGVTMSVYILYGRTAGTVLIIAPCILVLPMIKSPGLLFASLIILFLFLDQLIYICKKQKDMMAMAIIILLLIPGLLMVQGSWKDRVQEKGFGVTLKTAVSKGDIIDSFVPSRATDRQKTTIENYKNALFRVYRGGPGPTGMPWWVINLLIATAIIIRWSKNDKNYLTIKLCTLVCFGGLAIYLFGLLVMYMFSWGGYEGIRLASFTRYMKLYVLALAIIGFALLLFVHSRKEENFQNLKQFTFGFVPIMLAVSSFSAYFGDVSGSRMVDIIGSIFVVVLFILYMRHLLFEKDYKKARQAIVVLSMAPVIFGIFNSDPAMGSSIVTEVRDQAGKVNKHTPDDSKIFFIWQDSNGYQMQIFSYEIIPRSNNQGCWSVGSKYRPEDVWTCEMGVDEFRRRLNKYDYLYVGKADNRFWLQYGDMFESGDVGSSQSLFEIPKSYEEKIHRMRMQE